MLQAPTEGRARREGFRRRRFDGEPEESSPSESAVEASDSDSSIDGVEGNRSISGAVELDQPVGERPTGKKFPMFF